MSLKFVEFLLCLFGLSACVSVTSKPDPHLVVAWEQVRRPPPFETAYWADFQHDRIRVRYIAAHHVNNLRNDTISIVGNAFEKFRPRVLMIEGIPWEMGYSPKSYSTYALAPPKGDFIEGGEPAYAAALAIAKGIPYRGGEPGETEILNEVVAEGYAKEDLVGFYVVRQYPEFIRSQKIDIKNPEPTLSPFIKNVCKEFQMPENCFNFSQFKIWYMAKAHKQFGTDFDNEEAAPYENGKYFTQRISGVVSRVRNKFIVLKIGELVDNFGEVLVVYGASHLPEQLPALEKAYGAPVYKIHEQ